MTHGQSKVVQDRFAAAPFGGQIYKTEWMGKDRALKNDVIDINDCMDVCIREGLTLERQHFNEVHGQPDGGLDIRRGQTHPWLRPWRPPTGAGHQNAR